MSKKILIIGASGFVGNYLFNVLKGKKSLDVFGTFNNSEMKGLIKFDYSIKKNFKVIEQINPDIIIWTAGDKNLKKTETSLSKTLKENLNPIKTLLELKKFKRKLKIIFMSSDYVFDGGKGDYTISDIKSPKSFYGISKVMTEEYIISNCNNYNIIRAGAIIGKESVFINWLVKSLKIDVNIDLFDNLFSPTPIINLCNCIEDIIIQKYDERIIHINGGEKLSRYDLGVTLAKLLNSKNKLIKKSYKESELKFFKDLSLISSFKSERDININDYLYKLLK